MVTKYEKMGKKKMKNRSSTANEDQIFSKLRGNILMQKGLYYHIIFIFVLGISRVTIPRSRIR